MYPKIAQFKSPQALRDRLQELGIELPVDDRVLSAADGSPLAQPLKIGALEVGNRWCIHPMEGWDANLDGSPTEKVMRRWRNFGRSGAKLIWGGEAAAVEPDARANPRQTLATPENLPGLRTLLDGLLAEHRTQFGNTDDLLVGLQLTHSGRFCLPQPGTYRRRIAYHHPLLDPKFGIDPHDDSMVLSDDDVERIIDRFVTAAGVAAAAGFAFVDIKACHGYLLHEFLSAWTRPGRFGGDYAGRTRVLLETIARVRAAHPSLMIGVRLSAFDSPPFARGPAAGNPDAGNAVARNSDIGQPQPFADHLPYRYAFGVQGDNPLAIDLTETIQLIRDLKDCGVVAVNLTAGCPYYNPHLQRPATFPPSDGYLPPEVPLLSVWRQIDAVRQCKQAVPDMPLVGTGYSYLQDYSPHVAQAVVAQGWVDAVGLGRMVLSYPELPADTLSGKPLARKRICRTFSDCTTAPRHGLESGCYPLDEYYKDLPAAARMDEIKAAARR